MEHKLRFKKHQTIVVGSGAAGLNAAVSLRKEGCMDVAIVTNGVQKGTSFNTGSDKQTYYKLSTCGEEDDSVRKMAKTLFEGGSVDGDLALVEAALSLRCFFHLVDIGVPFPYNESGEFVGYKTDHDPCKRGTSAGPLTSKIMVQVLQKEVKNLKIPIYDGYQVIEILTEETNTGKRTRGLLTLDCKQNREVAFTAFSTDNIVYAVGGEAALYETSVYPHSQIGGMGAAFRIGARGKNLTESQFGIASVKFRWNLSGTYQQAIPRYFSTKPDLSDEQEFLDGYFDETKKMLYAIFLKGYQWPFDPFKATAKGSSLIDLLVFHETFNKGRRVFMDYRRNPTKSEMDGAFDFSLLEEEAYSYLENSDGLQGTPIARLESMNPAAIELYSSHNIDLYKEPPEIAVCAQHGNGGLAGNDWWESNISHLFPVGEVNGSHGIARPGGSALNAGQVGSLRAAQFIARHYVEPPLSKKGFYKLCKGQVKQAIMFGMQALGSAEDEKELLDIQEEKRRLGIRTSQYASIQRSAKGIEQAIKENHVQELQIKQGKIKNGKALKDFYLIRDVLVSQRMYLESIQDYISHNGKSRGSYFIYDESGEKPSEKLPEEFRFSLAKKYLQSEIQEVEYDAKGNHIYWRKVREMPVSNCWFEKVWREFQR